ncbi:DUF4157 domain-containing protein [Leptolyngbya sp. AN02str]|uniref:eCIS core domain-containing protein n=1 Tax=Leptolyngbya sp. AN02str TaxID=3423363 RepID=UPI003D316299
MPRRSSPQKQGCSKTNQSPENLTSRAFAVQAKPESTDQLAGGQSVEGQNLHRTPPEFSIFDAGIGRSLPIQPKLTIGAPNDKYEQEADQVAKQVVQLINTPNADASSEPSVQRNTLPEEDELQTPPMLQQRSEEGTIAASPDLESRIQQSRGSGQPIAESVRQPLEQAFGHVDFSGVTVHTDTQADRLNRSIHAKAFTTGQDIFFRQGAYQPGSLGGQELLAHELTHVVQQSAGSIQRSPLIPQVSQHPLSVNLRSMMDNHALQAKRCQCSSCGAQRLQRQTVDHVRGCQCSSCGTKPIQPKATTTNSHLLQRNREKMQPDSPQLVVNVSDNLLSKGGKLLKSITRPPIVNDATADKLSNCALTTMAAIEGGKTSGQFAQSVRARQNVDGPKSTEQSQKLWAITLADAATLKTLASGNLLTDQHHLANKDLIKSMEEFSEGNAYVVGDAQYYGMLNHLLTNAKQDSNSEVQFKVYEHGEPGNQMYPETALVSTMQSYPDGTRFAVFVYSSDPTQHVRAHWIYAEAYNGNVIFKDYQPNVKIMAKPVPVDNYLNQFPFSPDKKEAKKTFESGSFIAYVPFFNGEVQPVIADKEVDPQAVAGAISDAQSKLGVLAHQLQAPGEKFSSDWSARMGSDVTEIPAPSVIEAGVKSVAGIFGISPRCSLSGGSLTAPGMIKIIGNPIHSSGKVGKSVRGTLTQVNSDKLSFQNLTNTMKVVKPGQSAVQDTSELPTTVGKPDEEAEYRQAFSKAYQIQAQAGTDGISLNANWMEFTDLIHEATHSFEGATMDMHLREGLTDLFASMVAQQVQSSSGDNRWEFSYNPSYAPYVAGMQDLTKLLGLPTLAKLYFTATDHAGFLKTAIETQSGGSDPSIPGLVARLLSFDGFPGDFNQALGELRALLNGIAPTQTLEEAKFKTDIYDPREAKFGQYLTKEATRLGTRYGKELTGGSQTDVAQNVETWSNTETAEKRLKILYNHKWSATGQQFAELMKLIDGHENAIALATGETKEELRLRLVPMHKDFIVDSFWAALDVVGNSTNLNPLEPFFEPKTGLLKSQVVSLLASPKWKQWRFHALNSTEDQRRQKQLPRPDTIQKIEQKLAYLKVRGRV